MNEFRSPYVRHCSKYRTDNDFVYRVIRRPGEILHRIGARHSPSLIATSRRFQTTLRNNNHRTLAQVYTCVYAQRTTTHTRGWCPHAPTNARTVRFHIPASIYLPDGIHWQIELTHIFPLRRRRHVNVCAHLDGAIFFLQSPS